MPESRDRRGRKAAGSKPRRRVIELRDLFAACFLAHAVAPIALAAPDYPNDTASCPGFGSDTCYRADQMGELAATGERMVNDYLDRIGITGQARPRVTYIPAGSSAVSDCVDINRQPTQNDRALNYCATDNTVYLGQMAVWDSYRQFGSAGTVSGLAHEYGHFLQAISGVPLPVGPAETIRNEDQADCFSGAFMGYQRDLGDLEEPADVDGVEHYLTATASADAPGRDHGTAAERIASFELGYTGELPACNVFYPATPLTPAP